MIQILLQILMHLQQGYMREGKGPIYCDIRPCWYYPLLLPHSVKQHLDLSQSSPNRRNLSYIQFHPLPPNFIDLCLSWNRSNNSSCMCNIHSIRIISNINNTDSNNTSSILSDFSCILSYISTISNISNSTLCIVTASSAVSLPSQHHIISSISHICNISISTSISTCSTFIFIYVIIRIYHSTTSDRTVRVLPLLPGLVRIFTAARSASF